MTLISLLILTGAWAAFVAVTEQDADTLEFSLRPWVVAVVGWVK